jgi:hypothetical protein
MGYTVTLASGTATISLTSPGVSPAAISGLINGITYQNTNTDTPTPGNRTVTLTQLKDNGGNANGGADTSTLSLASMINVVAVNDAPVVTITGATSRDLFLAPMNQLITGVSISDLDAGTGNLTVSLTSANGTLIVSSSTPSGVTSGNISGNGSGSVTLTGTRTQINATLATLAYNTGTFTGNTTLSITVNDNGNTGGGALTGSGAITLRVTQNLGTLGNSPLTATGRVSSSDPSDRYQFTLSSRTNNFRLSLMGLTANAVAIIRNNSGVEVARSTGTGASRLISGLRLAAGTYLIEVTNISNSTTPYTLSFRG